MEAPFGGILMAGSPSSDDLSILHDQTMQAWTSIRAWGRQVGVRRNDSFECEDFGGRRVVIRGSRAGGAKFLGGAHGPGRFVYSVAHLERYFTSHGQLVFYSICLIVNI